MALLKQSTCSHRNLDSQSNADCTNNNNQIRHDRERKRNYVSGYGLIQGPACPHGPDSHSISARIDDFIVKEHQDKVNNCSTKWVISGFYSDENNYLTDVKVSANHCNNRDCHIAQNTA